MHQTGGKPKPSNKIHSIASQLASYLDLNSLHELSRTCRQFRANLLQYRSQLVAQSMRCENEFADHAHLLANCFRSSRDAWTTYGRTGQKIDRITSGKVGACARDMVGECRKCNRAVCRVRSRRSYRFVTSSNLCLSELHRQEPRSCGDQSKAPAPLRHLYEVRRRSYDAQHGRTRLGNFVIPLTVH